MKIQFIAKRHLVIQYFTVTKLVGTLIALILLCFTSQTNAQSNGGRSFVINGTVAGVDSGTIRMLAPDMATLDSAAIVKGKFILKGKIDLPERKIFSINPGYWSFRGFVDAPVITFGIDTSIAIHQSDKNDPALIWQIAETGSPLGDGYIKYQNETGLTDCLSLTKKLKTAKKDSMAYLHAKIDSIGALIVSKEKLWIEKYVHQNPGALAGVFILNEYYITSGDKSPDYLRGLLNQFSGAAKASSYYEALTKNLSNLTHMQVGEVAPDFTLLKRDGSKFKLSTMQGSVTMLDFWASWCVPCRQGIPHWKDVYAKYHDKNFNIVSVSNDRNWSSWAQALDHEKMPWMQVIDQFPSKTSTAIIADLYEVNSMPFFVLLNQKGKVLIASNDEGIVTKKIEELFNN